MDIKDGTASYQTKNMNVRVNAEKLKGKIE